jgi:hypothetical protein
VFVANYWLGYQQRNLLDMLQQELQQRHARLISKHAVGETTALRYAFNP